MEDENGYFCKAFGNSKIDWKIDNFSVITCLEEYNIDSAEFSVNGPTITRWKFGFVAKRNDTSCMVLFVERLKDSGPVSVHVNWSLIIEALNEKCYYSEYTHEFRKESKKRIDVYSTSNVLSTLQSFNCDTLTMRFHFIVQHRDKIVTMPKPEPGIRSLSDDLGSLFRSRKDIDSDMVILKVEGKEILAHKAIVCRNAALDEFIVKAKKDIIDFTGQSYKALKVFIEFLYTGNLDKILNDPSIGLYKCLEMMDKDLLQCYYSAEELSLITKLTAEELEHLWLIPNFTRRKEKCINSPVFKKSNMETTWQVRLYPNVGDDDNYYLSVEATIVEGPKPKHLCLEFGVEDHEGDTFYPAKILSSNEQCDMKIKEFVKKACVSRIISSTDDTLHLVFRVRTWDGKHTSKIGSHKYSFVSNVQESPYEKLSKDIRSLFHSKTYSDVSIKAEDSIFKAHRCILAARSPYFSRQPWNAELVVEGIAPHVLRVLLEYIYSGVLSHLEDKDLDMLCGAAKVGTIDTLVKDCQTLRKRIEASRPEEPEAGNERKSRPENSEKDETPKANEKESMPFSFTSCKSGKSMQSSKTSITNP